MCSGYEQVYPREVTDLVDLPGYMRIDRHASDVLVVSGNVGGEAQNTSVVPYVPQ